LPIKKHPEYTYEQARLKYTKKHIRHALATTEYSHDVHKENIKQAMLDLDPGDSSQSYISILTNTEMMKMGAQHHGGLLRATHKPYFARVDFRAKDDKQHKRYYIGKTSLAKPKDNKPIIIDWRSPIANIYYDGRLGEVSYESPDGIVHGDLGLKRQYSIEAGQLQNFMDIDITTKDAFLQASLHANADNRLKDIASTIQTEQNRVIRADLSRPLVVQGVAGSGKTTIALHRIAYLMYTYGEKLIPEIFMVLAPNHLFINYISEVLPELGVERTKQSTFTDFIYEQLRLKYKLSNPNEKLVKILEGGSDDNQVVLMQQAAAYKGSIQFIHVIDRYIREIEESIIPQHDFTLGKHVIATAAELRTLFTVEYRFLPLDKRLDTIKKVMENKLRNTQARFTARIRDFYIKQILSVKMKIKDETEKQAVVQKLAQEREDKLSLIQEDAATLLGKYFNVKLKRDVMFYYRELVTNAEILQRLVTEVLDDTFITYFCSHSAELLRKKNVEYEDLAALAYLQYYILGFKEKVTIQHVVIDEAQDYSVFQLYALRTILNTKFFTILGDISQGIHAYRSITKWEEVVDLVFEADNCQFLTLEQSYRTTVEVMKLANEVICQLHEGVTLAKPVIRHGVKPKCAEVWDTEQVVDLIADTLQRTEIKPFKTIAIIGKTFDECQSVHRSLIKKGIQAILLTGEETAYSGGVVVLPVYVAKGLEFDVVFIISFKERYLRNDLDIKLLYVAMTRALHRLYVGHGERMMPLLEGVDSSLWELWE
jgi:DNA helicase II / ATP-dependent DNA helicase PcrA